MITPTTAARIYDFKGDPIEIPLITLITWAAGLHTLVEHGIDIANIDAVVRERLKTPDDYPAVALYDHIQTCSLQVKIALGMSTEKCKYCGMRPVELCNEGSSMCSHCAPREVLVGMEIERAAGPIEVKADGFGQIIELAESYGWLDQFGSADDGDWTPEESDACEESALDFLLAHGVKVVSPDAAH